jgi:hypothetical protein
MLGMLIIVGAGVWWFTNGWIALGFFLIGIVVARYAELQRLHRQLATAISIVNSHGKELTIRRKQLTVQQSYGLIDDSKWDAEVEVFISRVVEPVTGSMDDAPKNRRYVVHAIEEATQTFRSSTTDFDPAMDPVHYEMLVADTLRDMGWQTRITKGSGDQGIDVIAELRGKKLVIQCKLYSNPVGNAAVQEAIAGMRFENAHFAAVVTNATFTASARQLATAAGVYLLHHEQLEKLEESIFGTSDWKQHRENSTKGIATVVDVPPSFRIPRVLRDALIIVGATVVLVIVVVFHDRDKALISGVTAEGPPATGEQTPMVQKAAGQEPKAAVGGTPSTESVAEESQVPTSPGEGGAASAPAGTPTVAAIPAVINDADDLSEVREVDSAAADHIALFCRQSAAGNATHESLCRMHEVAAWRRLVPGHEFPSLSQDIMEKCKLPPFPDSFVAKEACARYALSAGLR